MPERALAGIAEAQLVYDLQGDARAYETEVDALLSHFAWHSDAERQAVRGAILQLTKLYQDKEAKHFWITLGCEQGAAMDAADSFKVVDAELEFDSFAYSMGKRHEELHKQLHVEGDMALEVELAKDNIVYLRYVLFFGSPFFTPN